MNLDFSAQPMFSWYVVLLAFSGVVMIVLAAAKGGQGVGMRIFNALVGLAFLGYAVYLAFIFQGGTYLMFFKAFFLPVLLVINFFRSMAARRQAAAAQQAPAAQPYPQPFVDQPAAQPVAQPVAPTAAAGAEN